MVDDVPFVSPRNLYDGVVPGAAGDRRVLFEDLADAFERPEGRVGDGVGDAVIGARPAPFRPHEVIFSAVPEHERPLGVIRGGDLLVEGAVVEGHDTQQIRRQAYHVAVPPAAVVHVVAAVVVAEDELVDGLGPVDDAVDERLAQRIAERPGRGVGHGYADAAGFTLVDVVAGEEKVILAVGMDGRGRPHGAFHPLHLVVGDDPGVLLPVYEVFRREGVHEGLLVVVSRVGRVDPVGVAEDHPFGVGVPAREDGVAAPGGCRGRILRRGAVCRKACEKESYVFHKLFD